MSMDLHRLAYWMLKTINKAIRDYDMIAAGDRVAVAVSGGKDSLTLLRLLDLRRQSVPERYELLAIHVPGDARGAELPVHQPLLDWLSQNGYLYTVEPLALSSEEMLPLNCQRCTWNRRRAIFTAAVRLGCNVVALGHHADDLAQTTLLNLLGQGQVETMLPRRDYFDGVLRLVRPLCFTPEKETRRFARAANFPPPLPDCPRNYTSRRRFVADLLRQVERTYPDAREKLIRAGLKAAR